MKVSRRGKSKSQLSRIEEPSFVIPKPHRIDHILKSCFKDAYGKSIKEEYGTGKGELLTPHRTADEENNMAAEDEVLVLLKRKLEIYSQLENCLQQARAKAITEEEQHLSKMKDEFPLCNNNAIMKQSFLASSHLNESLLKEQGLLSLSDCIPAPPPTVNIPPRETIPSYLNSTVTSEQHARFKRSDIACGEEEQRRHEDDSVSLPHWKNSLSSEERQREKTALMELQRKVSFLHNPRQSAHKHSNTASNGPANLKKGKREKEKDTRLFVAEPSEMVFTDYSPGNSYEQIIDIRNISGASRQLRVTPPNSSYFKVKIAHFPNSEGIIAPGMSCSYSVQFIPDSLADFNDEIKVVTHIGECLVIPLRGYRPPPELSVPSIFQCGHYLVGDHNTITFPCINSGGEGNFKLLTDQQQSVTESVLILESFSISPTAFHLLPGASIDIKVEFHPDSAQLYSSDFLMVCDNGQINTFTIEGTGDLLSIGCVYVTPSADSISTAVKYAESAGHTPSIDLVDGFLQDLSNDSVVQFGHTNPSVPLYKAAVIKNYSGVKLSYQWRYYHPCTELSSDGSISQQVPTTDSPFSLDGKNEILPGETKLIPLIYTPLKAGESHVMAYMELDGIPLPSLKPEERGWSWIMLEDSKRISPLCLELKGYADPYEIELCPPLVCLADGLPPETDKRQTVKIVNHSISLISFEWNHIRNNHCSVSMEPSTGTIISKGCQYCECIITATDTPGHYSFPVQCTIINSSNSDPSHELLIKGYTQCLMVSVYSPSVQFGLIQLGHSLSESLTITNESKCMANYVLKQIVSNNETDTVVQDYHCVCFSPDHGNIPPLSSVTVDVLCGPMAHCGRLRTAIELSVAGKRNCLIPVSAEVQRPSLVLEQGSVYLDSCYVGIPFVQQVKIINRGLLTAQYEWINKEMFDHCQLEFSPSKGSIDSKESITIDLISTWKTEGYHTGVLAVCKVEAMSEPLLLSVSSRVLGLAVHYCLANQTEKNNNDKDLVLDFGPSNPLGHPKELYITVTNSSAITTTLSMAIQHYKSHLEQDSMNVIETSSTVNSGLLHTTENVVNPCTKTNKQKESDISEWLLSDSKGCCFTLSPSQCDLPPFQSQLIKVTAYSDMWGQYADHLICKVSGIEPRYIPINYGAIGCPVMFQTTATYGETIVRFGSEPARAKLLKRNLRLVNTSSSNIRIDWRVFNHIPNDDKLIDLITFIGQPFPRLTEDIVAECEETIPPSPLVRAIIQPHEGVQSSGYPFTMDQQQIIVNAKSSLTITVWFNPSIESYNELGEQINSYILGYCSLDEKAPVGCVRPSGYNVSPLRINVTATIQHSKLSIESDVDDNSMIFSHMASELITKDKEDIVILNTVSIRHCFSLINSTDAILTFKVTHPPFPYTLHLEKQEQITLKPHQRITGEVEYCIDHSTIIKQKAKTVASTDNIVIQFNTGAIQKFPITTKIHLPQLSIYPSLVDYETVHLSKSHTASVQLRNESLSFCLWKASVPQDYSNVIQISPMEGVLGTIVSETSSWVTTLNITFTPKTEAHYSVAVVITEILTQSCVVLNIRGNGSADEGIRTMKKKTTD